jgi:WD40 repeat protein
MTSSMVHVHVTNLTPGSVPTLPPVAFSPDGNTLVTVGSDDKHTNLLWNGRAAKGAPPLASMPGIQAAVPAVWGVAWNPFAATAPAAAGGGGEFVTYGEKHIKLWRKAEDGIWGGKVLSFDTTPAFNAHSAVFLPPKTQGGGSARSGASKSGGGGGRLLVGCADGKLALFDVNTRRLVRLVSGAHKDLGDAPTARNPGKPNTKGVRALLVLAGEGVVVSAGADGRILTWRLSPGGDDVADKPEEEIVLESPYGAAAPPPRIRAFALAAAEGGGGGGGNIGGLPGGGGPRRFFVGTAMCDLWWGAVQLESS